ncbi:cell division protein CrgA [Allonocardiopsis opalescens]|uniref:Cell division protein CrgA n=1 Tax=Allonocardiopsis opalescens TaxID=1144618 RepID=A0A2T0Q741_9ACTN|nr:cell division protein CrgA [Allonocardiopsis opalescens]PRX99601.1 uncharacterized protein UPF0233 [Allonocardiopsis opalescens]
MPKSRSNDRKTKKKVTYTKPEQAQTIKVSPRWLVPVMCAVLIIGILWLAVFYITSGTLPVQSTLGNWNLAVGFGFLIIGIILGTRWH